MRRFPISWDKTLCALGFRRNVKQIKRDYYRRKNSRIESLEQRAMLSGNEILVTTLEDQSDNDLTEVSLREAIVQAASQPGHDTITFDESLFASGAKTINLGDGVADPNNRLYIDSSLTIDGPGSELLTISAGEASRVFLFQGNQRNDVTIEGVTIADGRTTGNGAGIGNSGNHLTLDDVTFRNNASISDADGDGTYDAELDGGAIYFVGINSSSGHDLTRLTIANSTFKENFSKSGGAIRLHNSSWANVVIDSTTFENNYAFNQLTFNTDGSPNLIYSPSTAKGYGGALSYNKASFPHTGGDEGSLTIRNSTFAHNEAMREGGAINGNGQYTDVRIENSTISSNKAYRGGGLRIANQNIEIINSTITGNKVTTHSTSGGIDNNTSNPANLTLHNTIVAGNLSSSDTPYDLRGDVNVASSNNLIGLRTSVTNPLDSTNTVEEYLDTGLLPLGDYGGPTQTHALLEGSPAIDAGSNSHASILSSDQRGGAAGYSDRVVGSVVDIGAYESGAIPIDVGNAQYIAEQDPIDVATIISGGGNQKSWVASNDAGDTITVWRDMGVEGTGIYYSILNGTSQQLSQPRLVDLGQTDMSFYPKVVIDNEGRFAISWLSFDQTSGDTSYWIRRYEANGNPIDLLPELIYETTIGNHSPISITSNESGRILVVWEDEASGSNQLNYRRFTTSGLTLDSQPRIFTPTTGNPITLATSGRTAVVKSDGGFYLSWEESGQLKLAEFTPDGFQKGEAITIDAPAPVAPATSHVTPIDITLGPNDSPYIAWIRDVTEDASTYGYQDGSTNTTRELLVGRVESGVLTSTTTVTSVVSHDEWGSDGTEAWYEFGERLHVDQPTLSVDELGRFGIAWENTIGWSFSGLGFSPQAQGLYFQNVIRDTDIEDDYDEDYDERSLKLAWFGTTGASLTESPIEFTDGTLVHRSPTLTSDAAGNFILTTQQRDTQTNTTELWAQQYTLPQLVTLDEAGTLRVDDRGAQYDDLKLDTKLVDGVQRVTLNGVLTQFEAGDVKKIIVYAGHTDSRVDLRHINTDHFSLVGSVDTSNDTAPIEVYGGAGDDVLYAPSDLGVVLHGELGDDRLIGGDANDLLIGGEGDDLLIAGDGDDELRGEAGEDVLKGGEGNDFAYGGEGDDELRGDLGSDSLYGEAGNDFLYGNDHDGAVNLLDGGVDDDRYAIANETETSLGTSITLVDIDGVDTIDLSSWTGTVGASLDLSQITSQAIIGSAADFLIVGGSTIENIVGTPNDDTFTGNQANNRIEGGRGDDQLLGAGGDDVLLGQEGEDHLYGGLNTNHGGGGNDLLEGGSDDDTYYLFEETVASAITVSDAGGDTDTINANNATNLGLDSNSNPIRIVLKDETIDQTFGNVTLLAGSLTGIEVVEGHNLLMEANPTEVIDTGTETVPEISDITTPIVEVGVPTITEGIAWNDTLSLDVDIYRAGSIFYSIDSDAPEGVEIINGHELHWTPSPGQEGTHTFTVHVTGERASDSTIIRASKLITIGVANSDALPEIVADSFALTNPVNNATTTFDGAIRGNISYHDPFDFVDVVLTFEHQTITANSFTTEVAIDFEHDNLYEGSFEYQPTTYELERLLENPNYDPNTDPIEDRYLATADIDITATPRTWDENTEEYTLYTAGAVSLNGVDGVLLDTTLATTASITSLELANDTGTDQTDLQTTDPAIVGIVEKNGSVDDLLVQFYLGTSASGTSIGSARTDQSGVFRFEPEDYTMLGVTTDSELVSIYAEVLDRGPLQYIGEEEAGGGMALSFTLHKNVVPTVTLSTEGDPSNPELVGQITWPNANARNLDEVTIEFRRENSTAIEGIAVADEEGKFRFLPPGLEEGSSITYYAKAVYWDEFLDDLIVSSESSLMVSVASGATLNSAQSVTENSLALKYELSPNTASDPTVIGQATNTGNDNEGIYVEYSIGTAFNDPNFVQADGFAVTDENGQFEFTAVGLELDTPTNIYVRAAEWKISAVDDPDSSDPEDLIPEGEWIYQTGYETLSVTLVEPSAPSIDNLALVYDTGPNSTDGVSSDATISGNVTNYLGDMSVVTVEYLVNGVLAGELTPDEDGGFEFLAEGYFDSAGGDVPNEVRVRAIRPNFNTAAPEFDNTLLGTDEGNNQTSGWYADDYFGTGNPGDVEYEEPGWSATANEDWFNDVLASEGVGLQGTWYNNSFNRNWDGVLDKIEGDWTDFSFTLDSTESSLPIVSEVSAGGMNPTFSGELTNGGTDGIASGDGSVLAGRTLEFYFNGSAEADGTAVTNELGAFSYSPISFKEGINNLIIKLVEPAYDGGEPTRIEAFNDTYDITPDSTLALVPGSFALTNLLTEADGNTPATSYDPTLKGQIVDFGDLSLQIIEFDYDNDGIADASTYTDASGGFEFAPVGIGLGSQSVRARVVRELTDETNDSTYRTIGAWSDAVVWDQVAMNAPEFISLQLEQDTGNYSLGYEVLDGVTSNPNLIGQVISNGKLAAYQSVEFDHDGDGVVDGYTSTDSEGRFLYKPQGLTLGLWDIKARVVQEDIANDTSISTGWTSVTRTGRPSDTASGVGFELVAPDLLKVSSLSFLTDGVSLNGTVTWDVTNTPGAAGVVVEFFDDVTDLPMGSTTTDASGNFTFVPVGLEPETVDWQGTTPATTVVAKPVQSEFYDPANLNGTENGTVTADFDTQSYLVNGNLDKFFINQIDLRTIEINAEIASFPAFQTQYYELRIGEAGSPVEVVSANIAYGSNDSILFKLSHQIDHLNISDNDDVYVRPIGIDVNDNYIIGDWRQKSLPDKADIGFDTNPVAVVADSSNPITEFQLTGKVSNANGTTFNFNGDPVTWEYEVEYDLDDDGQADFRFAIDNPSVDFTHELEGVAPDTYYLRSRIVAYGTFVEEVTIEGATTQPENVTQERTLSVAGDWIESNSGSGVTFLNPGPSVLVDNVGDIATTISHPVATEATIVGSISSPIGATLSGMAVEVDENGDGYADGSVYVQADGTFEYTPQNRVIGENNIQLRGVDPYNAATNLEGDWTPLTFTLMPEVAPEAQSLTLETYQLQGATLKTDAPVITGKVTLPENTTALSQWVEFDHNDDGNADGRATLDTFGNFEYTPENLAFGEYTNFQVRTMMQLADQQLVGDWSGQYAVPVSLSFLYEPKDLPEISGDVEVIDANRGVVAGRATLEGFGYATQIVVSIQQSGTEVASTTTYSNESGRFEFELLELAAGNYDLIITPQIADPYSDDGYYDGISRAASINYSPDPLGATPELITFEPAFDTGGVATRTSDPTLTGTIDLTGYDEAPPQLYVHIAYDNGGVAGFLTMPVRSDGTFEWTPPGLVSSTDSYSYTAHTKIWDPVSGAYLNGSQLKTSSFELNQSENFSPEVTSLEMQFNETPGPETHVSSDATFQGQISNDGRLGGHTVLFDHNQDGIVDGQAITLEDGSFFYRAEGIEASDTLTQTMTAWVVETDYWGETLTSVSMTRDFILTRAPIIREVAFDPGTGNIEGSLFSETSHTDLWIEYELFGDSLPGELPPTDVQHYIDFYQGIERQFVSVNALGNFSIPLPVGATGNLAIALRGIDTRDLTIASGSDASSLNTLEYEDEAIKSIWDLLSFEVGASTLPSDVASFELVEDTGSNDDITSNPSVSGQVKPFELVELVTLKESSSTPGDYEEVATNRITADSAGNFSYASPYFNQADLGVSYQVIARTIAFDLTTQTETAGNDTSPVTFEYVANGTMISVTADTVGLVTGNVSAHATGGRVAGLRVEFDIDLGQGLDGVADGFAITDANGNYSYKVYGFTSGQVVDVVAQVVEWDPIAKEFTEPGFDVNASTVAEASFTASADVDDPTLSNDSTAATAGLELAEEAIEDAIHTVLAQADLAWLGDGTGNLDLVVWQTDVLGRGGVEEAGPDGDSANLIAIELDPDPEVGWVKDVNSYVNSTPLAGAIPLSGTLGDFDAQYSASRTFNDLGNNDWELKTTFEIWLDDYSHDENSKLQLNDASDPSTDTPSYLFEFSALGSVNADNYFVVDSYDTVEETSYEFHTVNESYTDDGVLYRTETTAGSYSLTYREWNTSIALGAVDRDFESTSISDLETWITQTDPNPSNGTSSDLSDHSTYYEKLIDTGSITSAGTSGTRNVDAQGFYESTINTSYHDLIEYENGHHDSNNDSSTNNYSYFGDLTTETDYSTGGASSTTYNLVETINSNYVASGSGDYSRSEETGNWNYNASGSAFSTTTLNGKTYEGTDYTSTDATISVFSNQSHSGSGGGISNYNEETGSSNGDTSSDIGMASSSYTVTLAANANINATLSSYNDDYAVQGTQTISSNVFVESNGGVDGTLSTSDEDSNSTTTYGTRVRSNASGNSEFTTNFRYDSAGESNANGNFSVSSNTYAQVASQAVGNYTDTSTDSTITIPFRDNTVVESTFDFSSDGDFNSQIVPGQEEIYSVTGNNFREDQTEIKTTEYSGLTSTGSDGNPTEASPNNFSLTKIEVFNRSLEDYEFENSNEIQSKNGDFEEESITTVEVKEQLSVEYETAAEEGATPTAEEPVVNEQVTYNSEKDSFSEYNSFTQGNFSDTDGDSYALADVDESFVSFGFDEESTSVTGNEIALVNGRQIRSEYQYFTENKIEFDNNNSVRGFVKLENGEAIDSLMDVTNDNFSKINTRDYSSVKEFGSRDYGDRTTSYSSGVSNEEKLELTNDEFATGPVHHDGSSHMDVDSTETIRAEQKNTFFDREGMPLGIIIGARHSSSITGSSRVILDKTTTVNGTVLQPATRSDVSGTETNRPASSATLNVETDSTTKNFQKLAWNISEAEGDPTTGGDYSTGIDSGRNRSRSELTENITASVTNFSNGDRHEFGSFTITTENEQWNDSGGSGSYRSGGRSGYRRNYSNISGPSPTTIDGTYRDINGDLTVNLNGGIEAVGSRSKSGARYKIGSTEGWRASSAPNPGGPPASGAGSNYSGGSSTSKSSGGGDKSSNESSSNGFSRSNDGNGTTNRSNNNRTVTYQVQVKDDGIISTTTDTFDLSHSSNGGNITTTNKVFRKTTQTFESSGNELSLKINNKSETSKTTVAKQNATSNYLLSSSSSNLVTEFPYNQSSTKDYTTYDADYKSTHFINDYGNAYGGSFNASSNFAVGTSNVYSMDESNSNTKTRTNLNYKNEEFVDISENGSYFDFFGFRVQAGDYSITGGNRQVTDKGKYRTSTVGATAYTQSDYSSNSEDSITLSNSYSIFGENTPTVTINKNSTNYIETEYRQSNSLIKDNNRDTSVTVDEDQFTLHHSKYHATNLGTGTVTQDLSNTWITVADATPEVDISKGNQQQSDKPRPAGSLEVGIGIASNILDLYSNIASNESRIEELREKIKQGYRGNGRNRYWYNEDELREFREELEHLNRQIGLWQNDVDLFADRLKEDFGDVVVPPYTYWTPGETLESVDGGVGPQALLERAQLIDGFRQGGGYIPGALGLTYPEQAFTAGAIGAVRNGLAGGLGDALDEAAGLPLSWLRGKFAKTKEVKVEAGSPKTKQSSGKISDSPNNQKLDTGEPLKDGSRNRERWYRITPEDENRYNSDVNEYYQNLREETKEWYKYGIDPTPYRRDKLNEFRRQWIKEFLENRDY